MIRLKLNDKVFLMYFLQLFLYKCIERLVLIPNSVHIGIRIIAIACLQKFNVKSYKLLVNLFSIKKTTSYRVFNSLFLGGEGCLFELRRLLTFFTLLVV